MGCNCKNKSKEPTPSPVIGVNSEQVFPTQEQPPYTRQEVIKIKDYLSSRNKTEEGRIAISEFSEKHFGENISGYCDQVCMKRINARLDRAIELLNYWDNNNKI